MSDTKNLIAFGPEAPGFGSWEWIGEDLVSALGSERATTFRDIVPECDVIVFVKFKPLVEQLVQLKRRAKLVYCPVDIYGSATEIDADWESLKLFDGIISHAHTLLNYFAAYAKTTYLDHHLKFYSPLPTAQPTTGPILWTGNAANLPPLVQWVNRHRLPEELWVLTNMETQSAKPNNFGFNNLNNIRIENWTGERHRSWAGQSRAALDIKGEDFRARHKPPTKAFDFIASGLPLAMNPESSSTYEVAKRGLKLASPDSVDEWLSIEYWQATQQLAKKLREELTLKNVAQRFLQLVESF